MAMKKGMKTQKTLTKELIQCNSVYIIHKMYDLIKYVKEQSHCDECCLKCDFVDDCYDNIADALGVPKHERIINNE